MQYHRFILLFIFFLLGRHLCFPSSPRYLELADSADYFIAHENWIRAEEKIIQALRLEPANFSNSLLLANLGVVQSNQGKIQDALESLSMGLNIAPSSTVLLNNRAHTYLLMDSISQASADIDRSLQIDSIQEWTLQTRGYLYIKEGNTREATRIFNKIKNIFPDNSSIYSGFATIDASEGNMESAKENYKKALELNPEDIEARENFILLLISTEQYPEARTQIREALKINPENPMFYLLRGYLHLLNYRKEEALADKKIAIAKGMSPSYASSFIP